MHLKYLSWDFWMYYWTLVGPLVSKFLDTILPPKESHSCGGQRRVTAQHSQVYFQTSARSRRYFLNTSPRFGWFFVAINDHRYESRFSLVIRCWGQIQLEVPESKVLQKGVLQRFLFSIFIHAERAVTSRAGRICSTSFIKCIILYIFISVAIHFIKNTCNWLQYFFFSFRKWGSAFSMLSLLFLDHFNLKHPLVENK